MARSLTNERQLSYLFCDEDDGDDSGVLSWLTQSLKCAVMTKVAWGGIVQVVQLGGKR